MTSKALRKGISSRESESGRMRYGKPDGKTTDRYGREVAHANPSPLPVNRKDLKMKDIYGLHSLNSSVSADLQRLLGNKLAQQLGSAGSTLYKEILKIKTTPAGTPYVEHTASALRTSGKGSTGLQKEDAQNAAETDTDSGTPPSENAFVGWPTPNATKLTKNSTDPKSMKEGGVQTALADAAWIAGWATPQTVDAHGKGREGRLKKDGNRDPNTSGSYRRDLKDDAVLAGWPTPNANENCETLETVLARKQRCKDGGRKVPGLMKLGTTAQLTGWPTPKQRDHHTEGLGEYSPSLPAVAENLSGWPTTTTRDWKDTGDLSKSMIRKDGKSRADCVPRVASLCEPVRLTATGEILTGSSAGMEGGGQLNPSLARWLMGLPIDWDICALRIDTRSIRLSKKAKTGRSASKGTETRSALRQLLDS